MYEYHIFILSKSGDEVNDALRLEQSMNDAGRDGWAASFVDDKPNHVRVIYERELPTIVEMSSQPRKVGITPEEIVTGQGPAGFGTVRHLLRDLLGMPEECYDRPYEIVVPSQHRGGPVVLRVNDINIPLT